jgi:poly(3-hydroxybutyrate) depolymerase
MKTLQMFRAPGRRALACGLAALVMGGASLLKAENPHPDSSYLYRQYANTLNYRLFIPPSYDSNPTEEFPLVVFIHGAGEHENGFTPGNPNVYNSKQMADLGQYVFVTTANQAIFPCFFVLIQKTHGHQMELHAAIDGMIDALKNQYRVDPDRVVITGLSGGGHEVLLMAQHYAHKLAAIVPICSTVPVGFQLPNGPVPAWFFHGVGDQTVYAYNAFVNSRVLSAAGGTPIFTLYNTSDHHIWSRAYSTPQLIPWIAAQRRGQPSTNDPASVVITSPSTNPVTVSTPSIQVSGSSVVQSGIDPQLTLVRYATDPYGMIYGSATASGGPGGWTTPSISLGNPGVNVPIEVAVLGTNTFSTYYTSGTTFYGRILNVTYQTGSSDTTAPTVTITGPTSDPTHTQQDTTINLSGTASDNVGVTVVEVYNDRTDSTTQGTGTANWTINNVSLLSGTNVLTVKARDAAGNQGTDTLTVTVTSPPPPPALGWTGVRIDSDEGSFSEENGVFTLHGEGEVWGSKSGMYYVYRPASGNCSITTRVTSVGNTYWGFGKAGVMIRDGLSANDHHVFLALTYSAGSVLYSSNAGDGTSWSTGVAPYWLHLERDGNTFYGYIAPDVNGEPGSWTSVGSRTVSMGSEVYVGMGCSSNVDNTLNTSTFDSTTTTGTIESWQSAHIGMDQGDGTLDGDIFTIEGIGSLWGSSDNVHFVYQNAEGDCAITARVLTVENTNWGYGRAGVMIRESTEVGAPYAFLGITGSVGSAFHTSNPGQGMAYGAGAAPYWVKLTRSGNDFIAQVAPDVDGEPGTWSEGVTRSVSMQSSVLIGLGVFSNVDNDMNISTLDNVAVEP